MSTDPVAATQAAAVPFTSVGDLIAASARRSPDAVAIAAPGRPPLGYAPLLEHVGATLRTLRAAGVEKEDTVALVVPDGPEMAAALLATASSAVAAPLNPGYRAAEFEFYLGDLRPRALVVQDVASPAVAVARRLGIAVLALAPREDAEAGLFTLGEAGATAAGAPRLNGGDDVALLLHTSGTTGRPKIVPLTHRNLCASARNVAAGLRLDPDDRCLAVMPLFHIHGIVAALLSSLSAGASIACTPGFDATRFFGWLRTLSATWYTAVPTLHHAVLAHASGEERTPALRFIRSCSSSLPPRVMSELERVFGVPVVEAYGMTEAAHQIACNPLPPGVRKPGSVGPPAGVEVAVVDATGAPLPTGVPGEIVIRGPNVSAGYRANPVANGVAFRAGWFRTGDQGLLDEDGYLSITGRLDEIINRGGEKIAPREVEEALLTHPGVAQALAFGLPSTRLGHDVAAAVVRRPGSDVSDRELQEHVATALSDFKVPRRIVFVPEIPKSATGKPRRIGLAERLGVPPVEGEPRPSAAQDGAVGPTSTVEQAIARAWASVLGREPRGAGDDFFRAGGDSILAGRMLTRIERDLGARLSFIDLFRGPTLAEMAAAVETARRIGSRRVLPPIARGDDSEVLPLSNAQQRLWFVEKLHPGLPAYKPVTGIRLRGPLAVPALEQAFSEIVARHEPLRARFADRDGIPVQIIAPPERVAIPVTEVEGAGAAEREAHAARLATAEAWLPFDIERGPMYRLRLLRLAADDHVLLLTVHHLAFDAWSRGVLLAELGAAYRAARAGRPAALPELPIRYGDYARWQQRFVRGDAVEADLAYWRQHLGEDPPVVELPLDRPRPAIQTFRGGRAAFVVPEPLRAALRELGQRDGATLAMTLFAAFLVLLERETGRDTLVVGVPASGRTQGDTEGLIGLFVNELVVRVDIAPDDTFRQVLAKAREAMLGAYAHQELPFDALVRVLRPTRDLSRSPLFQVAFNHKTLPGRSLEFGDGLAWSEFDLDAGIAPFEFTVDVTETPESLTCRVDYAADVFDAGRMAGVRDAYARLLEAVVAAPQRPVAELPVLGDAERRQLRAWNETATPYPRDATLHGLFAAQAARSPDALAIECGADAWTYARVARSAHHLARHLRSLGLPPGGRVAICLPQAPTAIVAMVAVLEAGGAYVPLDPAAPPERMRHVVQETGATILLAPPGPDLAPGVRRVAIAPDGSGLEALPGPEIAVGGEAGDVAVVIYTSGSTGAPKGSAIPHRGIVRLVRATNYVSIGPGDRVAQVSTFAFDAATFEVWGALLNGACLVQIAKETVLSPPALAASLRDRRVDVILLTTSLFHHVAAELPQAFGCVRDLLVGGEALDPGRARQVLRGGAPPGRLVNLYGPTENSTVSTWHWVQDVPEGATSVPIGRPISNTRCHILDRQRRAVPIGAEGELYLAGDGLAYGYWNDPAQTAACFVPSLPGEDAEARLYRTGDRARFRADGVIEFLGRVDDQVKIRGFRIEPGEIEMVLRDHAAVDDAAVLVRTIAAEKRLVAYVKPKAGAQPSAADLRAHAARKVPDYMIPAEWVLSETLPLTLSGKLDRRALPQQVARGPVHREVTAPRNRTEARLVALWKELLGAERVGTDEDFFEVGGHSLLAVRLVAEIEKQFGHELPVATLVRAPTIVQLAAILQAATAPAPASQRVHVLRSEGTQPPLLCVGPFSSSAGEITALAFRGLSAALGADQPVYALQPPELIGARTRYTIATVAAELLHDLRTVQAHGPYHLVGYCIGATLALEMASQLRAAGEEVPALVLVDGNNTSACDGGPAPRRDPRATLAGLASYASRLARSDDGLARLWTSLREKGKAALQWGGFELWQRAGVPPHPLADGRDYLAQSLVSRHRPRPYPGDVVVVYGVGTREEYRLQADLGWSRVVSGRVTVHEVQGDHGTILRPPHVTAVAERVRECLDRARAPAGRRDRTTGRGA